MQLRSGRARKRRLTADHSSRGLSLQTDLLLDIKDGCLFFLIKNQIIDYKKFELNEE